MKPEYHIVNPSQNTPRDLALVIPAYNGAPALVRTIRGLVEYFSQSSVSCHIVVVDDGSTDKLESLLGDYPEIHLLAGENQGKGAAIRAGFAYCQNMARAIGFIDVDGDYGPQALENMAKIVLEGSGETVIGWRFGSHGSTLRRYGSLVFSKWVWLTNNLSFDTQAGIKVFSRELVEDVLPELRATGFAIDVDILSTMRSRGWAPPVLYPVTLDAKTSSTVSLRRAIGAAVETWRLRRPAKRWLLEPISPIPSPPSEPGRD